MQSGGPAGSTVSQLKNDIDTGSTRDHVDASNQGLSPLGTDDEAAGRPNDPALVSQARREEGKIDAIARQNDTPTTHTPILMMIGVVILLVLVIGGAVYAMR